MRVTRESMLPLLCFGALAVLMLLLSVHTLTSIYQDIGRHIRLGGIIWETKSVPVTNLFSFTNRDFPFINHHWLGELALYGADRAVGLKGIIVLKALLLTCAFALALAAAWRNRSALTGLVTGFLALLVMIERTDVRPEIVSFLFIAWFLFVLFRYPRAGLIWTLPLVQLFWVNTHIYFFMGPFILVAWLVGEVARGGWGVLTRRHGIVAVLVAAATLCNPSFIQGALYPLRVLGNYGYSVMENKSPFFLKPFGYPQLTAAALYLLAAWSLLGLIANRHRWRANVMGIVLMSGTAVLALMMVRNFPLFALCALPATIRNFDEAGWRLRAHAVLGWTLALLVLFGAAVANNQLYAQARLGKRFGLIVPAGYEKPVAFYRERGLRGPLFNNFDVGSYLIWKLPEEPVFIDGRPEAYPADFIQDEYIRMQEDPAVWTKLAEEYGIQTIFWNEQDITPWSRAFVARITRDSAWEIIYREGGIIILTRRG